MDRTQSFTRSLAPILLILLLAAVLRIYHITQQSIWFDEAFAWNIIIQDDMFPRISTDTHPPLYYVLLRGWSALAGDSPLALRYLSALVSIMTVAMVYRLGCEIARKRPDMRLLPLFAALILALSDAEIFLAQEARNYALYTFFATGSMWAYWRWLRDQTRWTMLAWAGANALLVYTHYQGLFIPAIQGLHVLLFLRGRTRVDGVLALMLGGLPMLPWFLLVTIPQAQNAIDNSLPFAIESSWDTFLYLRDIYLGAVWALVVGLALLGLWAFWRGGQRGAAFMIALWLIVPFCVLFFGNFFAALLTERKLLIVTPAIALMVGAGLARMDITGRLLVAGALLVYGVATVDYYRVKEPWDAVAQPALTLGDSGDLYLAEVAVGQYPMKYYWQRGMPDGAAFATFPFLGDATMAPTTDKPTFYTYVTNDLFSYNQANRQGDIATAWAVYWSKDDTLLGTLDAGGYERTATWRTVVNAGQDVVELYRYDLMPAETAALYVNGMSLHAVEIDADDFRVDLWWSVDAGVNGDYTTSAALLDASGQLVAQWDSSPPVPTSAMQPGQVVYDGKSLVLRDDLDELSSGDYTVIVKVYRLTPEGTIEDVLLDNGDLFYTAGTIMR